MCRPLGARGLAVLGGGGSVRDRQRGPLGVQALRQATTVSCPPAATSRNWARLVRSMGIWAPQVPRVPPRTAGRGTSASWAPKAAATPDAVPAQFAEPPATIDTMLRRVFIVAQCGCAPIRSLTALLNAP